MKPTTHSDADTTNGLVGDISTPPAPAKRTRKRRMAREPCKVLATPPAASTATVKGEIDATPSVSPKTTLPSAPSKTTTILTLLRRDGGATLEEMIAATGWLPHTTRAVLTGLRKKGHVIERAKRDDVTIWRITGEA